MEEQEQPRRTLTDADIDAILDRGQGRFYKAFGTGMWAVIWRGIIIGLIGVAAFGAGIHVSTPLSK